jgi:hypothetical protein
MALRNGDHGPLTAGQIAHHLGVPVWNVTYELQLGKKGQPGRLPGAKVLGRGVGRSGQWRVDRETYLNWLQIPSEDRTHLGPDGLPELITFAAAAQQLDLEEALLRTMIRQQRWPHIAFGRSRYLTHNQLGRIRVQINEDCREKSP